MTHRDPATLLPRGISNADVNSYEGLANFRIPDPTKYYTYFEDFDYYNADDWMKNFATGSAAALGDGFGGQLIITTDTDDGDIAVLQRGVGIQGAGVGLAFQWSVDKELWFKIRFKIDEATQTDVLCGLQSIDSSPFNVTDGIWFRKTDGDPTFEFIVEENDNATFIPNVATLVDDTFIEIAYYYDSVGTFHVYVDDVETTELENLTQFAPSALLTPSFGFQNGDNVARTMNVDYIMVVLER